ncbi:MAG: hypothetical protein F4018_18250, partial [Acidobacteria bacterium]|nr:hypothetical protein [Acidobacteriota bacterium]
MLDGGAAPDLDRSTEYLLFDALRNAPERLPIAAGASTTIESHLQQLRQEVALHVGQWGYGHGAVRFGQRDAIAKGAHESAVDV